MSLPMLTNAWSLLISGFGSLHSWSPILTAGSEVVCLSGRRFAVLDTIGEGGYSSVYLVKEILSSGLPPRCEQHRIFALKQLDVSSHAQLLAARREISIMRSLPQHPNLLPMLDATIDDPGCGTKVGRLWSANALHARILLPYCECGTLWDLVQRGEDLSPQDILHIFWQVCSALESMHNSSPALAHRDVKPLNVLLTHMKNVSMPDGALGSVQHEEKRGQQSSKLYVEAEQGRQRGSLPHMAGKYRAVLMDFGSTRPARVYIATQSEAFAMEEDAQAQCSAAYCAPELLTVLHPSSLDERVDVWSLGCLLYYMLTGEPLSDGSLTDTLQPCYTGTKKQTDAMTILEQRVGALPDPFHQLLLLCLAPNMQRRPFILGVKQLVEHLLKQV